MKLRWSASAYEDRVAIYDYIEKDSPDAAILVDDRILRSIEYLARFPATGRKGRREGTRELPVRDTSYIVAYRIKEDEVEIIRIVHAAQRWPHFKLKQ